MIDKTTEGITAEPEEVEAVLNNLCGYHLAERDPAFRYAVLTREQVLYDALVQAIKRERGRALADLVASGQTLTQVAQRTNLGTRQRVQRLIAISKAAQEAAAAVQAASREFEAKLAAVEATLDEVVSGIGAAAGPPATPTDSLPVPSPRLPVDDLLGATAETNLGLSAALVEPTRALPAVGSFFDLDGYPEDEAVRNEESRWWRRGRDTGAA